MISCYVSVWGMRNWRSEIKRRPRLLTPKPPTFRATIRALIAAIRGSDTSSLSALIGEDLAGQIREEWKRRADTLETLIATPGAIEYTPDMRRALLRYEPGRAVTLEQSPTGWKIISLK